MRIMRWNRIPKNVLVEINTLHFWAYHATATCNRGNIIKCEVLQRFSLTLGKYMISAMLCNSNERNRIAQGKPMAYDLTNNKRSKEESL